MAERPKTGKARSIASLSAAAAIVIGVGAASAFFVDYLADRARAAEAPVTVKPVVAKALETSAEAKVAALAPDEIVATPSLPVEPPKAEIEAEAPDPAAVAKVAAQVGPEHAIELPTDDPTASPIVKLGEVAEDVPSVDESVTNEEPLAADVEQQSPSDETETAAIAYAAQEPAIEEQPVKKPKRQKAVTAEPQPAQKNTEVASLPGVDVGGLAGHRSDENDNSASTVRTGTKAATTATKNLGGVPAGPARVTAAVKLRTGPSKGNGVAGVVPAGSAVNVLSCNGWCQIAYNGRTGWIYKNYLTAPKAGSKPKQAAARQKPAQQKAASSAATEAQPAPPATRKIQSSRL
jgi:hypothetical protein